MVVQVCAEISLFFLESENPTLRIFRAEQNVQIIRVFLAVRKYETQDNQIQELFLYVFCRWNVHSKAGKYFSFLADGS